MNGPPSAPWILRIPNEILHHIFCSLYALSFLQPFVQYQSNGQEYEVSQMLVLRSVCRHFRAIATGANFWCQDSFQFRNLVPPRYRTRDCSREREFLGALFSDENLAYSVGQRKTDWTFGTRDEVLAVLDGVPLFVENARKIQLVPSGPARLDAALDAATACSNITTLSTVWTDSIDFSMIAASFPFLESLTCMETRNFHGSLEQLGHLQELVLSVRGSKPGPVDRGWLPLRSAETLTVLDLLFREANIDDTPLFDTDSLSTFVNLKSLTVQPLNESCCKFVVGAPIQLDIFYITLSPSQLPFSAFVHMLRADSLQNLKEFGISTSCDYAIEDLDHPYTVQYWSLIFNAFTSMLPSVQAVELETPFQFKWCAYFGRMANLKTLTCWANPHFGGGDCEDPTAKIVEELDAAFANFIDKPQIDIRL